MKLKGKSVTAPGRPRRPRPLRRVVGAVVAVVASAALVPVAFVGAGGTSAAAAAACTAPAWSSTAIYTNGNQVTYQGRTYRAKWWTQGEVPGTTGEWGVWVDLGACDGGPTTPPTTTPPTTPPPTTTPPDPSGKKVIGYFTNWGTYARNFHAKDLDTSGSAAKLTHILYAFGNVQNGRCTIGDSYADHDKAYTAAQSVDGVADTWDQSLRGNFNQLRKLKAKYPHLKILWSFGGWTWSGGFGQAAQNPTAFAQSCRALVEDPRWADVFDGIDIDWEYPNACGLTCDSSGPQAFPRLMQALRASFGNDLVTAAITADGTSGGKIERGGYGEAAQYVNWYMPMTYDYFGAFAAQGPTAPHSPLASYPGIPTQGFDSSTAIAKLRSLGIPSSKLLLGIGFYGRGWAGVSQSAPGGSASGPAPGTYEQGIEDYKVLKQRCPATGTVGGTAYATCGDQWWSYDTPQTIGTKMAYAKQQGLAGAFFWELSGDTSNGELITAVNNGLK
jgi:chitinase